MATVKWNWCPLKDVHEWYAHYKRGLLTVSFVDEDMINPLIILLKRLPATQTLEFQGFEGTGRLLLVRAAGYLRKLKNILNRPPHFILALYKWPPLLWKLRNSSYKSCRSSTHTVEPPWATTSRIKRPPLITTANPKHQNVSDRDHLLGLKA